ncbi:hypothetical protein SO802_012497 [Lithocarpus litseifolius]|uniref:Protein kinase domain-containing protein n=1 Tax=Lithocarpus litseifolius TaxID=425828 RepID=A0AAW2D6V5_9ROSI
MRKCEEGKKGFCRRKRRRQKGGFLTHRRRRCFLTHRRRRQRQRVEAEAETEVTEAEGFSHTPEAECFLTHQRRRWRRRRRQRAEAETLTSSPRRRTSLLLYLPQNEHGQRLLVYEYVGNGSLHDILHFAEDSSKTLTWNARVRIALGTARALEHMEEEIISGSRLVELNEHNSGHGLCFFGSRLGFGFVSQEKEAVLDANQESDCGSKPAMHPTSRVHGCDQYIEWA